MRKRIAGIALVILCMLTISAFSIIPAAGTTASAYWYQNAASDWYMNKPGTGTLKNAWVQDIDSSWYYLDSSGKVLSGIVIDGGHAYILQSEHDGYYGRLVCSIEPMVISDRTVVFNNLHNGTYGEIISIDGKPVSGNTDFSSLGMPIHMAENPQIEYVSRFPYQGSRGNGSAGSERTNIPGRVVPAASPSVAEPENDVPVASPSDAGSKKKEEPEKEGPKNNLFDDGVLLSWKKLQSPFAGSRYGYNASAITDRKIGNEAFKGCKHIVSITIPEEFDAISDSCFKDSSIEEILVPDSLRIIFPLAFSGCTELKEIHLPEGVTKIAYETFSGCSNLSCADLPGVKEIDSNAFSDCTSLAGIGLPEGLLSIGPHAFEGCTALTELELPSGVRFIGDDAFCSCKGLTSLILPDNVEKIGHTIVCGCKNLKIITYKGVEYTDTDELTDALEANGVALGIQPFVIQE